MRRQSRSSSCAGRLLQAQRVQVRAAAPWMGGCMWQAVIAYKQLGYGSYFKLSNSLVSVMRHWVT